MRAIVILSVCALLLLADDAYITALSYYYDDNPSNDTLALDILSKTADNGNADAAFLIAVAFDQGSIVPQKKTEALRWYEKAARLNDADAMMVTAWRYYKGEGCDQNLTKAQQWLEKASEKGEREADELLRMLEEDQLF